MDSEINHFYFLKGEKLLSYLFFLSLIFFYTGLFSVFIVNENLFLFMILSPKLFIVVAPLLVLYQIVFNGEQSITLFKDKKTRKNYLNKMIISALIAIAIVMAISIGFLFYVRYLIKEGKWTEPAAVSNYTPSILDSLIILFNFISTSVASYAAVIWYMGRSFTIKGFDEKGKKLVISNRYLLYLVTLISIVLVSFVIDITIVTYLSGGSFGNLQAIKTFIEKAKSWILLIEGLILTILAIYFLFTGNKALKERTYVEITTI